MIKPILNYDASFIHIDRISINGKSLSKISIDSENIFSFIAPKKFSILIDDMSIGTGWEFTVDDLTDRTIRFINHDPKLIKFIRNKKSIDSYLKLDDKDLKDFFIECIEKCSEMVVTIKESKIDEIICCIPFYCKRGVMDGTSDICLYSASDNWYGPRVFKNYLLTSLLEEESK